MLALCLTAAGVYGLIFLLFFAAGWTIWMWVTAGMFVFVGLAWLYSDFIDATPNEKD